MNSHHTKYVLTGLVCVFLIVAMHNHTPLLIDTSNPLDGCYHVYLDIGSNVGIQVRKLYEPELYPKAGVHDVFKKYFKDTDRKEICAVGVEPNARHTERLRDVEEAYRKCGWNVRFFKESAAWNRSGHTQFFTDKHPEWLEPGAGIIPTNTNVKESGQNVTLWHLSEFMLQTVLPRKLPRPVDPEAPPAIIMKMDIEGSELEVMVDLLVRGVVQHIDLCMIEWHTRLADNKRKIIAEQIHVGLKAMKFVSKKIRITEMDDESDGFTNHPFPKC